MTTGSCCTVHPIAAERLGPVLRSTATTISPANYGRRRPTRSTPQADLLVVGHISTGDPSTPSAEAMAVRDGRIVGIGSRSDVDGLTDALAEQARIGRGGGRGRAAEHQQELRGEPAPAIEAAGKLGDKSNLLAVEAVPDDLTHQYGICGVGKRVRQGPDLKNDCVHGSTSQCLH